MFGAYVGFATVIFIAIVGGIYVIWDEKRQQIADAEKKEDSRNK